MARIVLDEVSKVYDNGARALHNLSLTIVNDEFVVVKGPSGSGKSTLLHLVAGLQSVSEGTLEIDGKDAKGIPPEDRDVAMVFQNYALFPHLSVFENIAFGLRLKKRSIDDITARIEDAAVQLQLENILKRSPKELSGGQRQRVALARALVREPRIFLFDEPLSNLNAELRTQLREVIRSRHEQTGATTVYVTHDPVEASELGDRIVELRDGQLVENSASARPETSFSPSV